MTSPYVFSSDQVNQLVIVLAQGLGLVASNATGLSQQQIDALKATILATAPTAVPDTLGAFTNAYKTVAGFVTDNSDPNNPHPYDGVDASGWEFLRAGANINAGSDTAEALTAREYTRVQYKLRFGVDPGDALINKMSNGIAFNVLKEALARSSNPNIGTIPDIDTIARQDAAAVVNGYFNQERGAWIGDALFDYFGTNNPFQNLIRRTAHTAHTMYWHRCTRFRNRCHNS